jgi:hypothetical protein
LKLILVIFDHWLVESRLIPFLRDSVDAYRREKLIERKDKVFVQFAAYSSIDTRAFHVETECVIIDLGITYFHPFTRLWKG